MISVFLGWAILHAHSNSIFHLLYSRGHYGSNIHEICAKNKEKSEKKKPLGRNGMGKIVEILRHVDGKAYRGRITMFYPAKSERTNGYYKIVHLRDAECKSVKIDSMRRKWSIVVRNSNDNGFIGKIGYIYVNPGDTTKENAY